MRVRWLLTLLTLLYALLAGCSTTPTAVNTPAPPLPTSTATAAPAATSAITTSAFTCPVTVSGTASVFNDSQSGLQFSFPSAWAENDCQRIVATNNGGAIAGQSIVVGNLFIVAVSPRRGMTIQDLVSTVEGTDETVTLTPIHVIHAVEADSFSVTVSPTAAQPPRFAQTLAIIAGTQNFYEVTGLVAQMSVTDTMPDQPIASIIATFDVP